MMMISSSISASLQSSYADYANKNLNVVEASNALDDGDIAPVAEASTDKASADVKVQTSMVAFNAAKGSMGLTVDFFA